MFLGLIRKICYFLAAGGCIAAFGYSCVLARADWLRRHPAAEGVAEAIRLEPGHPYAHTLRAELEENGGRWEEAERSWGEALRLNRWDAEVWMRSAILAERRGDVAEAERRLLQAAEASKTWVPRWALVNFYVRRGRRDEVQHWARAAYERAAPGDLAGLFRVLEGREVLELPIARRISVTAGDAEVQWVDWLLDRGDTDTAARLWERLTGERGPVMDPRFEREAAGAGLGWRVARVEGAEVSLGRGELRVELNGRQPEAVDLVSQRVVLGEGKWNVEAEGEGVRGLEWEVREGKWLVLRYRRPLGEVRAEGVVRYRGVGLRPR